jgi:hypothetical protein
MIAKLTREVLIMGRLALLLSSLAILACSDSPTAPAGREVPIATVVAVSYSGMQAGRTEIVGDSDTWTLVWNEIHQPVSPRPTLPPVDFGQEMLLLASLGTRPDGCYSVRIVAVEQEGAGLRAVVEETVPGAGCACPAAVSHPVHVVRLPRLSGPVELVDRRITTRCS